MLNINSASHKSPAVHYEQFLTITAQGRFIYCVFCPSAAAAAYKHIRWNVSERAERPAEAPSDWSGEPAADQSRWTGEGKEPAVQRDDRSPTTHREHPQLTAGEDHRAGEKYGCIQTWIIQSVMTNEIESTVFSYWCGALPALLSPVWDR